MEQIAQVHSEGKDRGQQPVLLENWKVRCMPEEAGAERLVEEEEVSEVPEVPEVVVPEADNMQWGLQEAPIPEEVVVEADIQEMIHHMLEAMEGQELY